MIFISVQSFQELKKLPLDTEAIEVRLDLFPSIDLLLLQKALSELSLPWMLTLRSPSHGGAFQGSEEERLTWIEKCLEGLSPPFCDLEYDIHPSFIEKMMKRFPKTRFVLSYHHFLSETVDLEKVHSAMSKHPAYTYKIALTPPSTTEALKALLFAKTHSRTSLICMGAVGSFARILGTFQGNLVNYASLDETKKTAPGQLSFKEMSRIYRCRTLNAETLLYGLIGHPVEKSQGHLFHNACFAQTQTNAVYVKMDVEPCELPEFFALAPKIGFAGLSVTMPLKELVMPFVSVLDPDATIIGAVNTLRFDPGKVLGCNTDGKGALDAVEKNTSVLGKHLVLLGAGGAAKAIAFEGKKRGARVTILNRTEEKAEALARSLGCEWGSLSSLPENYDLLINCTPAGLPIDPLRFRSEALAMDIVYVPKVTPFLASAEKAGCRLVYGEEMFVNQALAQRKFWGLTSA